MKQYPLLVTVLFCFFLSLPSFAQLPIPNQEVYDYLRIDDSDEPIGYSLSYEWVMGQNEELTRQELLERIDEREYLSKQLRGPIELTMRTVIDAYQAYLTALKTAGVQTAVLGLEDYSDTLRMRVYLESGIEDESADSRAPAVDLKVSNAYLGQKNIHIVEAMRSQLMNVLRNSATYGPLTLRFVTSYVLQSANEGKQTLQQFPVETFVITINTPGELDTIATGLTLKELKAALLPNGAAAAKLCLQPMSDRPVYAPDDKIAREVRLQTFQNITALFTNVVIPPAVYSESYYLVVTDRFGSIEFQQTSSYCNEILDFARTNIALMHSSWLRDLRQMEQMLDNNGPDADAFRTDPQGFAWKAGSYAIKIGKVYKSSQQFDNADKSGSPR